MGVYAAITSSSKTLTVANYKAVNTFVLNEAVVVFGLVTNSGLNFAAPRVIVAPVDGTQFSVGGFASGTVGSVTESGTGQDPFDGLGGDATHGDQNGDWMDSNGVYVGPGQELDGKIDLSSFIQAPGPTVRV